MQGQREMVLRYWLLESIGEFHWLLSVLRESLLPPPLRMVLASLLTSTLMEKVSEPLLCPGRVATNLCTAEGFGEPTPFIPTRMSRSTRMLILVPSKPLVSPPLYLRRLPVLGFPGHPQPWSLRGCPGYFEIAAPP
jgi:hypothetical protein